MIGLLPGSGPCVALWGLSGGPARQDEAAAGDEANRAGGWTGGAGRAACRRAAGLAPAVFGRRGQAPPLAPLAPMDRATTPGYPEGWGPRAHGGANRAPPRLVFP